MSDIENFDDAIRQALGEPEFPFDEKNWEKASALIDADRKRKKRRAGFFWLFGVAGGLLLTTGLLYRWYTPSVLLADKANKQTKQQTVSEKTAVHTSASSAELKQANTESASPNKITALPAVTTPSENSPNKTVANKAIAGTPKTILPSSSDRQVAVRTKTKNRKEASVKKLVTAAAFPIPVSNNNTKIVSNTDKIKTKPAVKIEKIPVDFVNDSTLATKEPATTAGNTQTPVVEPAASTVDSLKTVSADSILPIAAGTKQDSLAKAQPAAPDTPKQTELAKNGFSLLAGTAYFMAWEKASNKPGNGFNPVLGVSYSHTLGRRLGWSAGLQYLSAYNSNSKPFTITSHSYGFGDIKDVITIHPERMHYLVMPLRLSYPAYSKNAFYAGCNIGYLFYSVVETEQYSETAFSRSNSVVTRSKGVFSGFNSLDVQAAIAYRRKIYKNLSAQAELFSGLSDIIRNKQFDAGAPQKNRGIKFTIHYDLSK